MTDEKARKKKDQALHLAISSIEKEFGKGAIMRLKDGQSPVRDIDSVPTGSLALDICLGIGGYPRGRVVEVFGPEASGKTTLALHAIANVQRLGGVAAFIDAEHALDLKYARRLGVDTEELLVAQPDYGEQALEIADMLVKSGTVGCIVIDSVAALVPKAELEGDMGDSHVGLQARLMSQALRKLTSSLNRSNTLLMFINQLRMKIGVMFGSPETTTGGNALKFYSSVRLRVARIGAIKEAACAGRDPQVVGNRTRVKVVTNKMAPPFRECEFDILYGYGISRSGDVIDLATDLGIVEKSGSWYSFAGERLGQGREKSRLSMEETPGLVDKIANLVLQKHNMPPVPPAATPGGGTASETAAPKAAPSKDGGSAKDPSEASTGTASPGKSGANGKSVRRQPRA